MRGRIPTPQRKNFGLAAAVLAGLLSLFTVWISGYEFRTYVLKFGRPLYFTATEMHGLDGDFDILFRMPLWVVIGIGIVANGLQRWRSAGLFPIPRLVEWITTILAVACTLVPLGIVLTHENASLGVGWYLGMFCALTPLLYLLHEWKLARQTGQVRNGDHRAASLPAETV